MGRQTSFSEGGSNIAVPVAINQGGTGAVTAPDALEALGVVVDGKIPNVLLNIFNAQGLIPSSAIEGGVSGGTAVSIAGSSSVALGSSNTYIVTNFDFQTTYTLTYNGVDKVIGSSFVIIAPSTGASFTFSINGRLFTIGLVATVPAPVVPVPPPTYTGNGSNPLQFTISNYDPALYYRVTSSAGTVTRNGAIITYTSPNSSGVYDILVEVSTSPTFEENQTLAVTIPVTVESPQVPEAPTVVGNQATVVGTMSSFSISNYDSRLTYTVTNHSSNISNATYIAPSTIQYLPTAVGAGTDSFTVVATGPTGLAAQRSVSLTITEPYQNGGSLSVTGPTDLPINSTGIFTIINHIAGHTYTVEPFADTTITATVSNDRITVIAGAIPGTAIVLRVTDNGSGAVGGLTFNVTGAYSGPTPVIDGPTEGGISRSYSFTIVNFDPNQTYETSVSRGTVSRNGAVITVYTPTTEGEIRLTVNQAIYNFMVNPPPYTEAIIGPDHICVNERREYIIDNFSTSATYSVTASAGTAVLSYNKVIYTSPSSPGIPTFTLINASAGTTLTTSVSVHAAPIITGPESMKVGTTGIFTINNYEPVIDYDIRVQPGVGLSRNGSNLTITAPDYETNVLFYVASISVSAVVYLQPFLYFRFTNGSLDYLLTRSNFLYDSSSNYDAYTFIAYTKKATDAYNVVTPIAAYEKVKWFENLWAEPGLVFSGVGTNFGNTDLYSNGFTVNNNVTTPGVYTIVFEGYAYQINVRPT